VDTLNPQMILLIDHQTQLLMSIDGDASRPGSLGMFAADELPLNQKLSIEFAQPANVNKIKRQSRGQLQQPAPKKLLNLSPLLIRGPAHKRVLSQISGKPNAAAHDDIRLGPGALEPLADRVRE
jgi:hypothetical protein